MTESWRVVMVCTIKPIADVLAGKLRELGHEPVAVLAARRDGRRRAAGLPALSPATAPAGVDLLFARDKHAIERLVRAYEPDLLTCWGFPWKIPQAALDVPRLGSVNMHPALLPRHRGPIPLAWALREGDAEWGPTWHRMDAELDTGNMLAQTHRPDRGRRRRHRRVRAAPPRRRVGAPAARARAGRCRRSGRPAAGGGRELGGALHGRRLRPGRLVAHRRAQIHNQVRAWHLTFGMSGLRAPVAELDGEEVVLLQTRLTDPGGDARASSAATGRSGSSSTSRCSRLEPRRPVEST